MSGRPWAAAFGAIVLVALVAGCGAQSSDLGSAVTDSAGAAKPSTPPSQRVSVQPIAGVGECPASSPTVAARRDGLPDLTFPCLGPGPDVRLAGLRGTPTVVNVWASWCGPCRTETPILAEVNSKAKGAVRFLGIDVDDRPAPARAAVEDFGGNFPSVQDPDALTKRAIGYPGPPVTLFVGADGVVTHKQIGEITSSAQLRSLIRQHLSVTVP